MNRRLFVRLVLGVLAAVGLRKVTAQAAEPEFYVSYNGTRVTRDASTGQWKYFPPRGDA